METGTLRRAFALAAWQLIALGIVADFERAAAGTCYTAAAYAALFAFTGLVTLARAWARAGSPNWSI